MQIKVLCFFHCPSNIRYAIERHEYVFSRVAHHLAGSWDDVHFAYTSLENGRSHAIPETMRNIVQLDFQSKRSIELKKIQHYISDNQITIAIGFDQRPNQKSYKYMRAAGVKRIISYWGAPMSSINHGVKLWLKKLEVSLLKNKPDLFIFQSQGMRKTAVNGRGIPLKRTYVVRSGIDLKNYEPDYDLKNSYAHEIFNIDRNKKLIIYSGHMEHRKGVHVIVQAAVHLIEKLNRSDVHFIFFGNRPQEEKAFHSIYKDTPAEQYITFGGYRNDLHKIQPCCYAAVLATTGWDSFPMSTIEVSAAGVPLLVSDLLGVRETVLNQLTGLRFKTGDAQELANKLNELLNNRSMRDGFGKIARKRAEHSMNRHQQIDSFLKAIETLQ